MDAEKKKEFESGDKIMPYDYEFINVYNSSIHPSTVHCRNTALVNYHSRYLFKKILSVFDFKGLPEEWADNYFKYILFGYGFIAVFDTDRYGVIPQGVSFVHLVTSSCVKNWEIYQRLKSWLVSTLMIFSVSITRLF